MKTNSVDINALKLEDFLDNNYLTKDDFEKANFSWAELQAIGLAHQNNIPALSETAGLISSILQQEENVHSVRWRIKDPEHLMSKIIRKRNEDNVSEKYLSITKNNYSDVITDLVGIRVLHLFKEDWEGIHNYLNSNWEFQEPPIVYSRAGDSSYVNIKGSTGKTHPAGYRSVHYIISTRLLKKNIYTEIQVRTIFEEAWSEIDHHVRYPNFTNNDVLNYFLLIFNRFAGSADEMGTFVLSLKNELRESIERRLKISEIEQEKENYIARIEELVSNVETGQKITSEIKNELKQVKSKLNILQRKEKEIYQLNINRESNYHNSLGSIKTLSNKPITHFVFADATKENLIPRGLIDSFPINNNLLGNNNSFNEFILGSKKNIKNPKEK